MAPDAKELRMPQFMMTLMVAAVFTQEIIPGVPLRAEPMVELAAEIRREDSRLVQTLLKKVRGPKLEKRKLVATARGV